MSPKLQEELLQHMSRLPEEEQRRVLAFMKGLQPAGGGVSGKSLLKFSGVIGQSDLHAMTRVIEEGCERIDRSEW